MKEGMITPIDRLHSAPITIEPTMTDLMPASWVSEHGSWDTPPVKVTVGGVTGFFWLIDAWHITARYFLAVAFTVQDSQGVRWTVDVPASTLVTVGKPYWRDGGFYADEDKREEDE